MKNYTFHWELKDLVTQFIKALDDCIVKRYNEDKEVEKEIDVKYVYAPKSRTLNWLVNKQQHIALPAVSVWPASVSRDQTRVFNKIDGPTYMTEEVNAPLQPIPVNITLNVSLMSKYQNDMDQMISNFVPYFDPYIILSWKHPSINREIRSEVEWNGQLSYKYPTDIAATDSYRMSIDTSFTIKGWLFKKADEPAGDIYTVHTDFIPLSSLDIIPFDDYEEFKEPLEKDSFSLSGIPIIKYTTPIWVNQTGGQIDVRGGFLETDSVYLSADSSILSGGSIVDLYSDQANLSADNPPFVGLETTFDLISDSEVKVDIPQLQDSGLLDIIILNNAGYGSIIKNVSADSAQKDGLFVI